MNEKNVVLLGGSTSIMANGLKEGIRQGIERFNAVSNSQNRLKFDNFALGGCTAIQNLYEVIRHKEILHNAELIITNSNVNELHNHALNLEKLPLKLIYRQLSWFYKELFYLNKKVLILIQVEYAVKDGKIHTIINNLHKKFAKQYGFNIIDTHKYYEQNLLQDFGKRFDNGSHQFPFIMRELGKNIIKNIENYQLPRKLNIVNDNPKFLICTPQNMKLIKGNLEKIYIKNSQYNEEAYRISNSTKLQFPKKFNNYLLIGFHSWNNSIKRIENFKIPNNWIETINTYSSIILRNKTQTITKEMAFLTQFITINSVDFKIDNSTFISSNSSNIPFTEYYTNVATWHKNITKIESSDIISFFLASPKANYHTVEIDFEALANENIKIPKEYDFNHLIPPIELYKEIIDEYCFVMDPRKLAPLQNQIKEKDNIISTLNQEKQKLIIDNKSLQSEKINLQNKLDSLPIKKQNLEIKNLEQDLKNKELQSFVLKKELGSKFVKNISINYIDKNSAKARIQNHLSYKLGQALIENSKSILGYIRMPYVLSYIRDKHKFEQKAYEEKIKENPNLTLPPLESYPDYNEALKEKECFTYKLGQEFIKA
ncbi:TPA: hypothetical protein ACV1OJ_000926, partial [Campylobacter jejuni]